MRCFEKVSLSEFKKYYNEDLYDFKLPARSTKNSAGYDFFAVDRFVIKAKSSLSIVSGVKASMNSDEVLYLFSRSSMAIKNNITLKNNVAVIDCDFYNNPSNEGNICFVLENNGDTDFVIEKGSKYAQGVFMKYLITDDDCSFGFRNGGIGSTLM